MKTLKIVLLVALLLSVVIVAGCQEGYSRQDTLTKWEPTGTGFWRPVTTPVEAK
jgi:hypothetical protein